MLTVIVLIVIVWMLIYLWYVIGDCHARNQFYEEKKEILKEKDWWIDKFNDSQDDLKSVKKELKDAIEEKENIEAQYFILQTKAENLEKEKILTIAEANKKMITQLYEVDGLSLKWIATIIWCGTSTIQRAVKKRGLVR